MVGPMHPHPRAITATASVSRQLNQEWYRLAADADTSSRVASWSAPLACYGDAASLLDAVGRDGGLPMAVADQLLAELVRVGRQDGLAVRIALQRVLPGLVRAAVRRAAGQRQRRQCLFDDLVANAWLVIRTYPLERRPIKIAVNVLRDAEYLTCVRPARLRSAGERPVPLRPESRHLLPCGLDGRPEDQPDAASELAEVLAYGAAAGVGRRDVAMLGSVALGGWSSGEVARQFAVTTRTVRNRKVRTTAALAALMAATTAA
jgi:hypothetical protein